MKKEYNYILLDIDDTLIDFKASETIGLRKCFEAYDVVLTDEDIEAYDKINHDYWKMLEAGLIEKKLMLDKRFDDFIQTLPVKNIDGSAINQAYQKAIGDHAVMFEGAYEFCMKLKISKKLYAVTNGTKVAQDRKLSKTGLDKVFDGIFISDVVGYQKPDKRYFDLVFKSIPNFNIKEAIMIGDSLSSDMKGANNCGVDSCWFNPKKLENSDDTIKIDYVISSFDEIIKLVM